MIQQQENQEEVMPSVDGVQKAAEMKAKGLSSLVGIYIDSFSAIMLNGNGTSYQAKVDAANALKEAIRFALDFGVEASKAKIRQGGKLSKEVNVLAGIMVQAMDNRMLLLASKMNEQEKQVEENSTETKGE